MEQCDGFCSDGVFHSHNSCEMVYRGVFFGKLKLPQKKKEEGYNLWKEVKYFQCPTCKNYRLIETVFWINRFGDRYDDNGERIGRVDKWKPIDL